MAIEVFLGRITNQLVCFFSLSMCVCVCVCVEMCTCIVTIPAVSRILGGKLTCVSHD